MATRSGKTAKKKARPRAAPAPAPSAIASAWAGGKIPRAVLILGPETALREEALAGLRQAAFGKSETGDGGGGGGGMNWVVRHAGGSGEEPLSPAEVLDEVCTPSLFAAAGEPKVVVVRKAEALLGLREPRETFERNLGKIPNHAVLVFEVAQAGPLKSTRFYKALAAGGGVVLCEALRSRWGLDGPDSPLAGELQRRARTLGLALNPGAAAALIERSGQELGMLDEELAKLSLALGGSKEKPVAVRAEQIKKICADSRLVGAFEFADALAERNLKTALETLGAIFAHGLGDYQRPGRVVTSESSIAMRLLGALSWKLTQLQDLRAELDTGRSEQRVFAEAKLFGFRQNAVRRALRRHSTLSLRQAVEALLQANLDLRLGHDRRGALERLVWKVCRG